VLTHQASSEYDPNDPFWIILTDQSMIRGHSDIEEPLFIDFVRQVYDDLVRLKEAGRRRLGDRLRDQNGHGHGRDH
jgi:hypothetical protein